jgi:hypothetical protein
MIPLGSCTMKLNATAEMLPITWPEYAELHPFVPRDQAEGYRELIDDLGEKLCAITGFDAISMQPNSGAQGEYAGLMTIRAWHRGRDEAHRDVCLVPAAEHGTRPASAQMAGMKVVVVGTRENGDIDVDDFRARAEQHADSLAACMITYPSTHGVFERTVREICDITHEHGGQVYLDGANLNAMMGLSRPGDFGPGSQWYDSNTDHPGAQRQAEELAENALIGTAIYYHQEAQKLRRQCVAQEDLTLCEQAQDNYGLAADAYQKYLERYPNDPQACGLRYDQADAYC